MTTAEIKASIHEWADTSNTAARKAFSNWLQTASYDELEAVMELYEAHIQNNQVAAPFSEQLHDSIETRLDAFDNAPKPAGKLLMMPAWKVAAAAVILFCIAFFIVNKQDKNAEESVALVEPGAANDVPAGTNRAFLQLSNGHTIELDGLHASELSSETAASLDTSHAIIAFPSSTAGTDTTTYLVSTPAGGRFQLLLPDNSKVWLNAKSSIRFPKMFKQTERNVAITGEAYFEVTENKTAPFKVHVNDLEVKVLGTHFNINAFPEDEAITTTLLQGSVQLKHLNKQTLLRPGFHAVSTNNELHVAPANTANAVAWKNGMFAFENTALKKVMQQLERWYDVDVQYTSGIPAQYFTGDFSSSFSLAQSLRVLAYSGLKFKIEGKKIIVL